MPPSFERLRREDFADDDHRHASTMRCFLEDRNSFRWPEGLCKVDPRDPTVCHFETRSKLDHLLVWERHLDVTNKGGTTWLEQRKFSSECQELTKFRRRFVVKGYINVSPQKRGQMVEVANMKGLRHPHVAALLGTCSYPANFWILSYPPGCCDLGDYMASISQDLGGKDWRGRTWKLENQPLDEKEVRAHQVHNEYCWPFHESLGQKLTRLRGYFICLAQALDYLKFTDIRHKDLKPDNIIIDLSGSVVVIDFGLARKFPPNTAQTSQSSTQRSFVVYQAPEVLEGEERGPPSDIFSLGCIYLEMASLILGRNLQTCAERCSSVVNQVGRNFNYGNNENLPKVAKWIEELKTVTQPATKDGSAPFPGDMVARLPTIERMLSKDPNARPEAHELWKKFDAPEEKCCRDCHPDHPEVWRATQDQLRAAIDLAKRSQSSQYDDRLRESFEFTAQARKASVAAEPLVRSSSQGPMFSSPMNSPRRGSFDRPRVRSPSPALVRRLSPRPEQQQGVSDKTMTVARSSNEQGTRNHHHQQQHQYQPAARPTLPYTDKADQKHLESPSASSSALTPNSPDPHSSEAPILTDEDFVVVDYQPGPGPGSDADALTSIPEEKRVQFRDEPASIIPSLPTTAARDDSPDSSQAGNEGQPTPLTPETETLVLYQREVIWPAKESHVVPIANGAPANLVRPMPVEKIIVYDAGADDIYTSTTRTLGGIY